MFKRNPFSIAPKMAIALFVLSAAKVIAAPQLPQESFNSIECYGNWRITGTTYDGNPVDVTRLGYVYNGGCGIFWEGHVAEGCYRTRGLDGRIAR
jgi:hypothetical protein